MIKYGVSVCGKIITKPFKNCQKDKKGNIGDRGSERIVE
jgi:hypothetical protein